MPDEAAARQQMDELLEAIVQKRLERHLNVIAETRAQLAGIKLAADALRWADPAECFSNAQAIYALVNQAHMWLVFQEAALNAPREEAPRCIRM